MGNPVTCGWLVYRMVDAKPEFMGVYQTCEKAEEDIEVLRGTILADGWELSEVPFLGWRGVSPGGFPQSGKPYLNLVE